MGDGLDDTFLIKEDDNYGNVNVNNNNPNALFDDDQTWFVDDIVLNQENDDDQTWFERPIRSINLMANNLIGELPNELGLLTNVYQLLNFDTNSLSGSIPSSLSMLTKLQGINLSYNQFESTIPTELGSTTEMRLFDISNNESIIGTFPTELDQWRNIEKLYIQNTKITGFVPREFCSMITNRDPIAYEYKTNMNTVGENLVLKASCPVPLLCACCTECCPSSSSNPNNGQDCFLL